MGGEEGEFMSYRKVTVTPEEVRAMRESGATVRATAEALGISQKTVIKYSQEGFTPKSAGHTKGYTFDKAKKAKVFELLAQGLRAQEITEQTGLAIKTVYSYKSQYKKANKEPKPEQISFVQPEEKPVEPASPAPKEPKQAEPTPAPVPAPAPNPSVIETELFKFAYTPQVCEQLNILSLLADPEPWSFTDPADNKVDNPETTILELYINETFRERAADYNTCAPEDLDKCILIRDNFCCFHTGLYTSDLQGIYACYVPNLNQASPVRWYFNGFLEPSSPKLQNISPLPEHRRQTMLPFDPSLEVRINTSHVFKNPKVAERLPVYVRTYWNPALLLETAITFGRRKTLIDPSFTVSCPKIRQPCYLMPLYIVQPDRPDAVAVIEPMNGYNHVRTILTPKQAYLYARVHARPTVDWLRALVTPKGTG